MRQNYLNLKGEIESLTYREIKKRTNKNISWKLQCNINEHKCDTIKGKDIYNFINIYLGKVSICDFNNMMEWEHLFLYPHFIKLALKNGAIDKRKYKTKIKGAGVK